MNQAVSFDPIWEEKYAAGHAQRYPWDSVVTFVFRNAPRDRPRADVRILELGFGTASNLWFAAREGFSVAGIEGSASGVAAAQARFEAEGLAGDLRVGDFTDPLPFPDSNFDLILDRAALSCCGFDAARRTIVEVARVLRRGGSFMFTPYSIEHPGRQHGKMQYNGTVADISDGHLRGFGQVCFYDEGAIHAAFDRLTWHVESLVHHKVETRSGPDMGSRAQWLIVARRS